jgi:hypothetical protein
VASAPIGDARAIYRNGVLSLVNRTAASMGFEAGQALRDAVEHLLRRAWPPAVLRRSPLWEALASIGGRLDQ